MELDIVISATDPARAVELLARLGIRLEEPNRPNPGRWHGRLAGSITVGPCRPDDEPGLALAVPGLAVALAAIDPAAGATLSRRGATLLDLGGAAVAFRIDGGAVSRPAADECLLPFAETILRRIRLELAAILASRPSASIRLAGPHMLDGSFERRFALVVAGADAGTMAELRALLDANAEPTFRIDVVDAAGIDPETDRRIDRLAWDLHL